MATVTPIDEASFPQTVLAGGQPVLVEFTAEWCPPCKRLAPVLAELSMEYAGRLRVVAVDTDDNPDLAAQYGVQVMPTLVLFQGGREVQRLVGYAPKIQIQRQLDQALARAGA
jgi:thioredoxin 1